MGEAVIILVVVLLFLVAPPVVVGLQGWARDRARRRVIDQFARQNGDILLVNTRRWPEADPAVLPSVVCSSVVRCLDPTRFSLGSLRQIVGGEMKMFTANLTLTRDEATERMRAEAKAKGYDAVVNIRYETSQVSATALEIIAYGTAIRRRAGRPV
ncbi:MAG: heavy metal-binding domain-containing protein [Polyangia bacterium]|jgi:uncharacterized protein YbjQ (UPF0145 family)|nr:heavy metal-binding domain-containing protein [Polyangia bacterium]